MKKFVKMMFVSALVVMSVGSFNTANVQAASHRYVHTLKVTSLFAKGEQVSGGLGDPKFNFSPVTDRALSANSDWYTDQTADSVDTVTGYSRVATNEWVKNSDVVYVNKEDTAYAMETYRAYPIFSFNANSYRMEKTNQTLPAGNWLVGTFMSFPDEPSYYQVGGNQWIQMKE